jgi:chromosome segregation ATPase
MITCRGCNNELDNCTCDVPTTKEPTALANIGTNESDFMGDKLAELQQKLDTIESTIEDYKDRIKGLEELMPTKEEAQALLLALESYMFCLYGTKKLPEWAAKLQKIIDKRG